MGLRWLNAGLSQTLVETKRGPKLNPGLRGLDLRDWLLFDDDDGTAAGPSSYHTQLSLKHGFLADPGRRPEVLQDGAPHTLGAQAEVLEMVTRHLHSVGRLDAASAQPEGTMSPIEAASRLVAEDLILMERSADTYRSVAACVAFSFGDVPRRIGEAYSMAELHTKVGRYAEDLHVPTERFMSRLTAERPVWRVNWNLVFSGRLEPHPDRYVNNLEKRGRIFPRAPVTEWDGPDGAVRRLDAFGVGAALFVKVEYQTFRRLVRHPDYVLFTIRTFVEPASALRSMPDAAASLAANIRRAVQTEFRHFKGLDDERIVQRALAYLDLCAAAGD